MTDSIVHRGPDDDGTYTTPGFAIGVRRLSIVDVQGGHQPFSDERGRVWAAQNGELYNHLDLRRELEAQGHRLASRCDTEVIPHLYERDGLSFPEKLNGMFAIALWDEDRRRAMLVRDRLGIKPLYWGRAGRDDRLRVGAEECPGQRDGVDGTRPRGDRRLSAARFRARPRHPARGGVQADAGRDARRRRPRRAGHPVVGAPSARRPRAGRPAHPAHGARPRRRAPRPAGRLRREAPHERRPGGSHAQRGGSTPPSSPP